MRIIYDLLTKDVVTAIEDDGLSTTAYSPDSYGVIQGDVDTIVEMVIAMGLDVSHIIGIDMNESLKRVIKDRQMGQKLFNRFLSENKQIEINTSDNIKQLQYLINVKMMLDAGALGTARDLLTMIPDNAFITTPGYANGAERKQSYIDEINTYILSQPQ